ncbi:hypothetical protein D3C85_1197260 [compost metagenome]
MHNLSQPMAQCSLHNGVFAGSCDPVPLFQLDQHGMFCARCIVPGKGDVDTLRGLRNVQLDGQAGVIGDFFITQHLGHVAKGAFPGIDLRRCDLLSGRGLEALEDYFLDVVIIVIVEELLLGGFVNDQLLSSLANVRIQIWSYFLLVFQAFSTGYFSPFSFSFCWAAALRSTPSTDARRTTYISTSANSSFTA